MQNSENISGRINLADEIVIANEDGSIGAGGNCDNVEQSSIDGGSLARRFLALEIPLRPGAHQRGEGQTVLCQIFTRPVAFLENPCNSLIRLRIRMKRGWESIKCERSMQLGEKVSRWLDGESLPSKAL